MNQAGTFYGQVNEDGSASVLARLVGLDGTGTTVRDVEGPCLLQANVSSITCHVYDLGTSKDAATGTEVTPAPTMTVSTSIYDTLQSAGWDTYADPAGYNFRHDLAGTYFPTGGHWYLVEYKFTLASGAVLFGRVRVKAVDEVQS